MYYKLRVIELMVLNILGVFAKRQGRFLYPVWRVYMYTDTNVLYVCVCEGGKAPVV